MSAQTRPHAQTRGGRAPLHFWIPAIVTLLALICAPILSGCANASEPATVTHFALDTVIEISVYDGDKKNAAEGCVELIDRYEKMLSRTIEGSDIWKINHSKGQPVEVSAETAEVLAVALRYCKLSDGKFDITIAPVSSLWDFKSDTHVVPDQAVIAQKVKLVDYRQIMLSGNTVQLTNPEGAIDLGAIAKGFIADKVAEYLRTKKVTSALINLGGNIVVVGQRPDGTPWRVGIQGAFEERNQAVAMFSVRNLSVVTSGIYERYFTVDGKFYHHILDTSTGYPIDNDLAGVSILSEKSVDGDALSTTCFTLGQEGAKQLIETIDGVEAVFIDREGNITYTSGIGTTDDAKYKITLLSQDE